MADQLGAWEIGVRLDLNTLRAQQGQTTEILQRVEEGLLKVASATKHTDEALHGATGVTFAFNQAWEAAAHVLEAGKVAFEMVHGAIEKVKQIYESTLGAAKEWAHQMEVQAQMVGDSVEHFEALDAGMKVFTGGMGSATTSLRFLGRNLETIAGGHALTAKQAMKELGISVTDAEGRMKNTGVVLDEFAPKFSKMAEGPHKTAIAMALFGRYGATIIPLLDAVGKSGKDMTTYFRDLGVVVDEDMVKASAHLQVTLTTLSQQMAAITHKIGADMAPAFQHLADKVQAALTVALQWIDANRGTFADIATQVATALDGATVAVEAFARQLRGLGPDAIDVGLSAMNGLIYVVGASIDAYADLVMAVGYVSAAYHTLRAPLGEATDTWNRETTAADAAQAKLHGLALSVAAIGTGMRQHAEEGKAMNASLAANLDVLAHTQAQTEQYQAALAAATVDLARMKDQGLELSASNALLASSFGLVTEGLDAVGKGHEKNEGAIVKNTTAHDKAAKAIAEQIQQLNEEIAALTGGDAAKLEALLISEKFKAATDAEKDSVRALSAELQRRKDQSKEMGPAVGALKRPEDFGKDQLSQEMALRKQAAAAELDEAKATGDAETIKRAEFKKTAADHLIALQTELQKSTEQRDNLLRLQADLVSGDEKTQELVLRQLEEKDVRLKALGASERQAVLDDLAAQLAANEANASATLDVHQRAAAAQVAVFNKQMADMRRTTIDFVAEAKGITDDIFSGPILGTKKWHDVAKDAWQSLAKFGFKTMEDLAIKAAFENTKIETSFRELAGYAVSALATIGKAAKDAVLKLAGLAVVEQAGGAVGAGAGAPAKPAGGAAAAIAPAAGLLGGLLGEKLTPVNIVQVGGSPVGPGGVIPGLGGGGPAGGAGPAGSAETTILTKALTKVQNAVEDSIHALSTNLRKGFDYVVTGLGAVYKAGERVISKGLEAIWANAKDVAVQTWTVLSTGFSTVAGWLGITNATQLAHMAQQAAEAAINLATMIADDAAELAATLFHGFQILGIGPSATGGYIGPDGLINSSPGSAIGAGKGTPILAHDAEGILNKDATARLGGESVIHRLNAGAPVGIVGDRGRAGALGAFIPAAYAGGFVVAGGVRSSFEIGLGGPGSRTAGFGSRGDDRAAPSNVNQTHFLPGSIVIQTAATDGVGISRDLAAGILVNMGR